MERAVYVAVSVLVALYVLAVGLAASAALSDRPSIEAAPLAEVRDHDMGRRMRVVDSCAIEAYIY